MKNVPSILLLLFLTTGCVESEYGMPNQNNMHPWVVRTDFSNDESWALVKTQVSAPQRDPITRMRFYANVQFVDDSAYANLDCNDLVHALPTDYPGFVVFVVDEKTIENGEHPILVIGFSPQSLDPKDYERKPSQTPIDQIRSFRAIPSQIQGIENNFSIANMDFEDFANAVETDGVFRGFPP